MFKFIVAILACLATVAASPAPASHARQLSGPQDFDITSFTMIGSGCPGTTARYTLNADKTAVTVTFSEFIAQAGPGIQPRDNYKNCQLTFGVHVPQGWSFGITNVDSRGYYQLDDKVTANQRTYYYFPGNQATCDAPPVVGAQSGYYNNRCTFGLGPTLVFCPCGVDSVLNINTNIRVSNANNPSGSGMITRDSNDISLITIFNFYWRTC